MNLLKPPVKTMSKKKMLLYFVLFVLLLLCFRLIWISYRVELGQPKVTQGVMDLQKWRLDDKRTISLSGDWEFYPGIFIDPNEDKTEAALSHNSFVEVPGSWHNDKNVMDSPYGYGTYRLKVLVKDSSILYGIRIKNINTSFRLYINGELLHEMGHPTETKELNKAVSIPYTTAFHTNSKEIDIMLHVSNFQASEAGGFTNSIKFGTTSAVMKEKYLSESMQLLVCFIILLHLIYSCVIYILGFRKIEVIYFAAAFICTIVCVLSDDDKLLFTWIPIDFEWSSKIMIIAYVGVCLFLTLCYKAMFETAKSKKDRLFAIICSIYCVVIAVCSLDAFIYLRYFLLFVVLVPILYVPLFALRGIVQGKDGAFLIFLSGFALSMNFTIGGIIKTSFWFDMPYYPFDLIISLICLASYWVLKFFKVTYRAQTLTTKLTQADKVKDDFLANTSHELRNPLHGMINIAQNVLDESKDRLESQQKKDLKLIITVGQRMSLLLNDLIDVTLLKEKAIRLNKQGLSLQAVATGVLDMLRYLTEGKQVELVMNVPASFPRVMADENRLIQILFNLTHNAIKYTHEGEIVLDAEIRQGIAYVHVKDSGVGMDEETVQRIFQPYEQGDVGLTGSISGLGLGLSICKQLVELHGGRLEIQTKVYQGSTFTFTLALEHNEINSLMLDQGNSSFEPAISQSSNDNPMWDSSLNDEDEAWYRCEIAQENRPRVIAVDDDPINLKVISNMLPSEHFNLTTVTKAEDALKKLEDGEWDLVISDVMMPNISGFELAKKIRSKFTISELPVLLVTARTRPEDVYAGFIAGANDYVMKPISYVEFKSRVHALINLKQSVRERMLMEAAWLHAQIQPHFLFNTLNSIASLSDSDPTRMLRLLEEFGNYLRISISEKNLQRLVPLEHELDLLRSYLYIEQERFGDRLVVEWEIPDNISIWLPPLSIQTIVENAVSHGILPRSSGGTVKITFKDEPKHIDVIIQDNGIGMSKEKLDKLLDDHTYHTKGIGLKNTDRRLNQIFGQGLKIVSRSGEGTSVSFRIPKMT
ncbi:Sensory/regulatory protein RpfC [compost metagenome]